MRRLVVAAVVFVGAVRANAQPAPEPPPPPAPSPAPPVAAPVDPSAPPATSTTPNAPPPSGQPPPGYGQPPPPGYGQPPPGYGPPPPPEPPSPPESTGIAARAGLGFGRYSERASGLLFESDIQPFGFVGAEGAFRAGVRGVVVAQAQVGLGIDVHMDAASQGQVIQNNRFHQEIYEGSLRYRWPGSRGLFFEVGYHFTAQQLHFTDISDAQGNPGMIDSANELVLVHAIEGGIGWRNMYEDGSSRRLLFVLGLNRGSAENDRIDNEDFSAGGTAIAMRATWHWPSGLLVEGQLGWRQQNGSDVQIVQVNGMDAQAFWPKNTTWFLGAVAGYQL